MELQAGTNISHFHDLIMYKHKPAAVPSAAQMAKIHTRSFRTHLNPYTYSFNQLDTSSQLSVNFIMLSRGSGLTRFYLSKNHLRSCWICCLCFTPANQHERNRCFDPGDVRQPYTPSDPLTCRKISLHPLYTHDQSHERQQRSNLFLPRLLHAEADHLSP